MDLNDTPQQAEFRSEGARLARGAQGARRPCSRAPAPSPRRTRSSPRGASGSASSPRAGSPARRGRRTSAARASARSSRSSSPRRSPAPACRGSSTSSASGCSGRRSSPTAPTSRSSATSGRCSTATRCGASSSPSPPRARTSPASRRAPSRAPTARWTLNGQKVWTTNAQFSAYGLLLARTDADVPKHKGLTMFIVPMDAEGVTVRGLRQITGDAEFNEVFFDDVQIPDENVVGGVGNGWGTALTTLMFERLTIGFGSEGMGYKPERFAGRIAADPVAARDGEVRQRMGHVATELLAVRFTGYRMLSRAAAGPDPRARGGPVEDHDGQRRDRGVRARRRRRRPRGAERGRRQPVRLPHVLPAGPEVRGRDRGDPAQHDRRARARPAARAAPGQGHPVQRAARQGEGAGGQVNLELSDEQVFLRDAARAGAVADEHDRDGARAARRRRAARPVARRGRGRLARAAGERGARRRGPGRVRRDARADRDRPARWRASSCSATCPASELLDKARLRRRSRRSPSGELRAAFVPAQPPGDLDDGWTVDSRDVDGAAPRRRRSTATAR